MLARREAVAIPLLSKKNKTAKKVAEITVFDLKLGSMTGGIVLFTKTAH